jgi:hypothetical protein
LRRTPWKARYTMSDSPSTPDVFKTIQDVDVSEYVDLSGWKLYAALGAAGGLILLWIVRKWRRILRSRRPPVYHPKLQPYAEGAPALDESLSAQRRAEAARIVATSSKDSIAGYDILEQVEAVFVEGLRRPEDALEGLKAAAAMKGANALTNVRHERTSAGKYAASGDAVLVRRIGAAARPANALDAVPGSNASEAAQSSPPQP